MANDGFQGTVLTFASTAVGKLVDLDFSEEENEVDVTDAGSAYDKQIAGSVKMSCTATVYGIPALAVGATGAIGAAWFNGTTDTGSAATFRLQSKVRSGRKNGEITTKLVFKPSA